MIKSLLLDLFNVSNYNITYFFFKCHLNVRLIMATSIVEELQFKTSDFSKYFKSINHKSYFLYSTIEGLRS